MELNHHEVHLMLMANPDGRKHAETGDAWRKNANTDYCVGGSRKGADLNRNFAFGWDCCGGSSNNECSAIYHGAEPASEPETQAIQAYMLNLFGDHREEALTEPASLNTSGIFLDIHSKGGAYTMALGYYKYTCTKQYGFSWEKICL